MRVLPVACFALIVAAGCSPSSGGGHGGGGASIAAATSALAAPVGSSSLAATGEEDVRPLVLVHGIGGSPHDWQRVMNGLGAGRTVFPDAYAGDIAAIPTGSVSRSSVWAVGYYKHRASDPRFFDGHGSIGGCPAPRTDQAASYYTVAYVDELDQVVEGILRATGAPQVDMCGCSMGGVVSRAYIRWRSGRGPNGASRVRRYLNLISPSRGLNDVEAIALCFDRMPFQRWGEIAEMCRDYPAWGGRSYIQQLNDGWDDWVTSHGVSYATAYGYGHGALNAGTLQDAIKDAKDYLAGATSSPSPSPSPTPPPPPPSSATTPTAGLGIAQNSGWATLQQALIFLSPARLDIVGDAGEILNDDADGFVRVPCSSAKAGPEFPHSLFDSRFHGLHLDRGNPDETIQYCTNTREILRRFVIEGRVPSAQLVSANLRVVTAGGFAPWLLLEYEVSGGDGFSVQIETEDAQSYQLRHTLPFIPDAPLVYAAPLFEGKHRLRIDGDPQGSRVATLRFYDASGVAAEVGPIAIDIPGAQAGPEPAPKTTYVGWKPYGTTAKVSVSSNGKGAELSWRLVSASDVGAWSPWSGSGDFVLGPLPAGTYELTVRSRHADNVAGELVEESDPLTLGVVVDGAGTITVRQ